MPGLLEKKIGYVFSDRTLLDTALTHSSLQSAVHDNERLEFLGDRVLGLVVADLLYGHFSGEKEGSLAKRHAALVQQEQLAKVALSLDLAGYLKLSPGEVKSGGQQKETILSDALEALIGAIYLDGGYQAAQGFIEKFWGVMLREQAVPPEDAKSKLQEWTQARSLPLPEYKLLQKSGTDHEPQFEVEVFVKGVGSATAAAASKRAAEKAVAVKMLEKIGIKE